MQSKQLWYTRRGNEIRGPFPGPQISRFILLGRLQDSDELSTDQHLWQKVSDLPILLPEELKSDLDDPEAQERLKIARLREDERGAGDRRDEEDMSHPETERRRSTDNGRRQKEDMDIIRHREIKAAIAESGKRPTKNYFWQGVFSTMVVGGIIAGAWYYQPWELRNQAREQDQVNCNAVAQPWVNWSNCLMDGVKLVMADLRGARLRNVNMAGADLRGANLAGADIAYANLVGAKLSDTDLTQAALVGANMRNADLSGTDLTRANLAYAIFQGADLKQANFTDADLTNADLKGAILKDTTLKGAILDHAIWIDGRICAPGSLGECKK